MEVYESRKSFDRVNCFVSLFICFNLKSIENRLRTMGLGWKLTAVLAVLLGVGISQFGLNDSDKKLIDVRVM